MADPINKPFLYLDTSAGSPIIEFKVNWEDHLTLADGQDFTEAEIDDILYISFIPSTETTQNIYGVIRYDLGDRSSHYDPTRHNKVALLIHAQDSLIGGFSSVFPAHDRFSTLDPNIPNFKPYLWLKFISADSMVLYIEVEIPKHCSILEDAHVDNLAAGTRLVRYQVQTDPDDVSGETQIWTKEYHLDATTGFDPVIETVLIEVVEFDATGTVERRKGQGTVHTSEGDASSDD